MVGFPWQCLISIIKWSPLALEGAGELPAVPPALPRDTDCSWGSSRFRLCSCPVGWKSLATPHGRPKTSTGRGKIGRKPGTVDATISYRSPPANFHELWIVISFPTVFSQDGNTSCTSWGESSALWGSVKRRETATDFHQFLKRKQSWNMVFGFRSGIAGIWFVHSLRSILYMYI